MFHQLLAHPPFMSISVCVRASFTALAFFILTLAAQQVSAATITVTNTADSGAGSLRQAVADANGTPANDTISFNIPTTDPNCNSSGICTITLTGGVIMIQAAGGSLTIANQTGAGKLLISGNNASRVFEGGLGANLTLDGLTVTRGVGGILSGGNFLGVVTNFRGTLTIMNSVFTQNTGELIIASEAFGPNGILNVINTTVSNNTGRGIFSSNSITTGGTLNVVNSTISNNIATSGDRGGIYFLGDQLRITNSTVSGNSGGIYIATVGGGPPGTNSFVLTNCTVTANTVTSGGSGIDVFRATLNLRNTIVSGNTTSGSASDIRFWNALGTSLGNNLIGTSINFEFGNGQWLASDMLNQNARLAPLGNYGGATQTHALLPNSPAIDAGNNCVLTANGCGDNNPAVPTDQRGAVRVRTVDIGAFELASRPTFDFDGDGKSDIAVFRPSNGNWYILPSQTNAFYGFRFGQSGDQIAPADYDGDGKTDVAVFRDTVSGAGNFAYFYILNSSNNSFLPVQFGVTGDVPMAGDWDGDGKGDLAVYRAASAAGGQSFVYYRPSSQPTVDFNAVPFGSFGDKPLLGDFDGDGRLDPAVFRPSNAAWIILRSSVNQISITVFGLSTDIPVPADYDGDGQANIAVFRPSTGYWYTSQNPQTNYGAIQFGANGDLPVPADYDGDGKADSAVFRPSNGAWYLNRTTSGFTGVQFGTDGDKPSPNAYIR